MTKVKHRFLSHKINPRTETLVIGTFNPDTEANTADFFYGRRRNFLWTLIPVAFNEASLKNKTKNEKLKFIEKYKIDFIDLVSVVDVEDVSNYNDAYLDSRIVEWRNVIFEIERLPQLKRVCMTRKSFGDIPKMKPKINEIENYCRERKIAFQLLTTPARFYGQGKQTEWNNFFNNAH